MLDLEFIQKYPERVKEAIRNKKVKLDESVVDIFLELLDKRNSQIFKVDEHKAEQNKITAQIQAASSEDRKSLIAKATELKEIINKEEKSLIEIENEFQEIWLKLPNITSPKMPVGKDDSENVSIRTWGEIPEFSFKVKDHIEIGKELDLIDTETAAEVSGSRFYYLKNEAVLIQFALIDLVFRTLNNKEILSEIAKKVEYEKVTTFTPVLPPVMMKPSVMKKMDRLDPIEERFELKRDELILIGSAEHTLGPLHMDTTFKSSDLPKRYIGYSTAFRREAGSYGQDTKGILRVHQFEKLEIETYVQAEDGEKEQEFILAIQEYLVQQLRIPYQVIQICTGDTGKPDFNQYDIECWIPSQNKYRETHTSDYMTDYQARRLNTKYVDVDGKKKFVHMNDATAFAITRILIAILENYQQEDGSVVVPEVLRQYIGKDTLRPCPMQVNKIR